MAKIIDLFAGIGGFHYALEASGHSVVYASEWDKDSASVYEMNHGLKPAGDITSIKETDIPSHDIIAGGFPCQAFSLAGKRAGFADPRGTLFFDIARIAKHHQPKLLFLENVRNFATHDNGKTLQVVTETLENIGYNVHHRLYNASNFGLPQNRQRFFIVAVRRSFSDVPFVFPEETNEPASLKDIILDDTELTSPLVFSRSDMVLDISKEPSSPQNKPVRIGQVGKGGQGERIYSSQGHAITLSAYGGGVGAKTGLYLINGEVRKLHPRECARVQGFPEEFILPAKNSVAWKQFGNSVPVNVLKHIAAAFTEQYDLG
jgi:DNA (cytosine-5)-methyltransferase 1